MISRILALGIGCILCLAEKAYCPNESTEKDSAVISPMVEDGADTVRSNLSSEGDPAEVSEIDIYMEPDKDGKHKFKKNLIYMDGERQSVSQPTDNFTELMPMDMLAKYTKLDTLTFNNINLDDKNSNTSLVQQLESAGITKCDLKNIAFIGCKNIENENIQDALGADLQHIKNLNSLIIFPPEKEVFPIKLLNSLKDKCNRLTALSLLIDNFDSKINETLAGTSNSETQSDSPGSVGILPNVADTMTTLYLTIKKSVEGELNKLSQNGIAKLKNLTNLSISLGSDISATDITNFFSNLATSSIDNLRSLSIDLNTKDYALGVTTFVEKFCEFLKKQTNLQEFDMSGCKLHPDMYSKIIEALGNNAKLTKLKMNGIQNFTDENMKKLGEVLTNSIKGLVELEICNCDMEQKVFDGAISGIVAQSELQSLLLDNNRISGIGDISEKCNKLIAISVANDKFTKDNVVAAITKVSYNRSAPLIMNFKNNIYDAKELKEIHNKYTEIILPLIAESKPIKCAFVQ